jgi:hypothetical protein
VGAAATKGLYSPLVRLLRRVSRVAVNPKNAWIARPGPLVTTRPADLSFGDPGSSKIEFYTVAGDLVVDENGTPIKAEGGKNDHCNR